ncbi:MAG: hypothetical protein OFPII_13290 [Osedax symbiont Rs1]|nr:MAG: hypothetical protein OFPII_13290 [Osedax symbiont Rs1]
MLLNKEILQSLSEACKWQHSGNNRGVSSVEQKLYKQAQCN